MFVCVCACILTFSGDSFNSGVWMVDSLLFFGVQQTGTWCVWVCEDKRHLLLLSCHWPPPPHQPPQGQPMETGLMSETRRTDSQGLIHKHTNGRLCHCNPCSISTSSALYWILWVLLDDSVFAHWNLRQHTQSIRMSRHKYVEAPTYVRLWNHCELFCPLFQQAACER